MKSEICEAKNKKKKKRREETREEEVFDVLLSLMEPWTTLDPYQLGPSAYVGGASIYGDGEKDPN